MKPQLIVFGEDWGALPTSTQHIIKQLRSDHSVTWINSLGLRSPRLNRHDLKRILNKAGRLCKQLLRPLLRPTGASQDKRQTVAANVAEDADFTVVEPQYLPFPGNPIARRINRLLLYRLLKRHAKPGKPDDRAVIWISLPNAVDALHYLHRDALKHTGLADPLVIYYCCDDFSALDGVDHQAVGKLEQELTARVDVIVATNPALLDKFPQSKDKGHYVPHGVDIELFKQSVARAADLPVGKPIAGFYGSIAPWIDTELLYRLAQLMPGWNFVLIGAVNTDISRLETLDNVYFLGPKPHHQLPGYCRHWQVSLLPFILNDQIMGCNPLKLLEYMATGQPIVSVDFPVVREYGELIHLAAGAEGFADAIHASQQEAPEMAAQRQLTVADKSWQSIAGQINGFIQAAKH